MDFLFEGQDHANTRARQLFLETTWFKDRIVTSNETFRLSAAWEKGRADRWFGRHRVAGLYERSGQDRLRRWRNEILVDQNNVAVTNAATPENAQNQLTRRHYTAENDYRNYYGGNASLAVPEFTWSE